MQSLGSKNAWKVVGDAKQTVGQMGMYITLLNMVMLAITLWHTTVSPIAESHGYTLPYWLLFLGLGVILVVLGTVERYSGLPGYMRSWIALFYTDDNPLKQDIKELKQENAEIKALLAVLVARDNRSGGSLSQ